MGTCFSTERDEKSALLNKNYIQKEILNQQEFKKNVNIIVNINNPHKPTDPRRFVLFPIVEENIWNMYKRHKEQDWLAEEIDLSKDYDDFITFLPDVQHFIKTTFAFFACADGVAVEGIAEKLITLTEVVESRCFLCKQVDIENTHAEVYSKMIEMLTRRNIAEMNRLFDSVENNPVIKNKVKWAEKYINDPNVNLQQMLVAFAAWEGVGFSTSFATVFWIKNKGKMPGTIHGNELIVRDESLHVEHTCALYNLSPEEKRLSAKEVYRIIGEMVELEKAQVRDALKVTIPGLSADMMCDYVEYITNGLLENLGYEPIYKITTNPLPFMEGISLIGRTSFFEKRNPDYRKARVQQKQQTEQQQQRVFRLDADF